MHFCIGFTSPAIDVAERKWWPGKLSSTKRSCALVFVLLASEPILRGGNLPS